MWTDLTNQPEESFKETEIPADGSADIRTADLPSTGQQPAPPTNTLDYNSSIHSDSTEEEDHLNKQVLKNETFSLLPLVHTTVIKAADYLSTLNREQENFLKQSQSRCL